MRQLTIPAGKRTLVFRRRFSSIPQDIEFTAAAADGRSPQGTVERIGSRWILGRTATEQPLAQVNRLRKGYWDTFFEVFVTPVESVEVTVSRPRMRRAVLILALVLVVGVIAVVVATAGR